MRAKKPSIIDVRGMSIQDIQNLDPDFISKLGEADLRKISNRLVSAVNKRIRRLEKAGIESPALSSYKKKNYHFSTKGKNRNKLLEQHKLLTGFLGLKTSSVRGATKVRKEVLNRFEIPNMSKKRESEIWYIYNRYREENSGVVGSTLSSEQLIKELFSESNNHLQNADLESAFRKKANEMYERKIEEDTLDLDSLFEGFDIEDFFKGS